MRDHDGRKLDHHTLEQLRIRAVGRSSKARIPRTSPRRWG
jgi:hypothetical protein